MRMVVCVPLAHRVERGEISTNAQLRAQRCLEVALRTQRMPDTRVVLAFGAGASPTMDKTLAAYTEDFFRKQGVSLPMLVNRHDRAVFGTLDELRWVIRRARHEYGNPQFVVVSQRRHIARVRRIQRWFFPDAHMSFVISGQTEEVPLHHEFLAYSKLLLVKAGSASFAEKFRRATAVFSKW